MQAGPRNCWLDAAQSVIRAEFNDYNVGLLGDGAVKTSKRGARGFARDTKIKPTRAGMMAPVPLGAAVAGSVRGLSTAARVPLANGHAGSGVA